VSFLCNRVRRFVPRVAGSSGRALRSRQKLAGCPAITDRQARVASALMLE